MSYQIQEIVVEVITWLIGTVIGFLIAEWMLRKADEWLTERENAKNRDIARRRASEHERQAREEGEPTSAEWDLLMKAFNLDEDDRK